MVRINLLPHRQIKRAERQRQFNLMVVAVAVAASAVVFMGQTLIGTKISIQAERNSRLETANLQLDKEIQEIHELKAQIKEVLGRKQVVENLQSNRSQSVVLLDELARQLPEGLYLKSIKQQRQIVSLEGYADGNARIAALVRNFSSSKYFESPSLTEIKSTNVGSVKLNNFLMTVKLRNVESSKDKGK